MAASQSLFRRHRNRGDIDENDNNVGGGGGSGLDIESSNQDTSTEEYSTTIDMPLSSSNNVVEGISSSPTTFTNNNTAVSNDPAMTGFSNDTSNNDEEQELIVQVPQNSNNNILGGGAQFTIPPVWEPSEEATAQRRRALHQEVERIQRANFLHFMVLCLVPTTLLIIVIAAILSEDGECNGDVDGLTVCQREPRSFVNAFTSRKVRVSIVLSCERYEDRPIEYFI